ncbi:MAG TPA: energy transducer TonB, partial [Thermoanaerobaculia bacterium]
DLKPLQVGAWTVPPKPLHPVLPAIGQAARQLGLRGTVVVATSIDAEGKVCDAQVVRGLAPSLPSLIDEPARQSVLATPYTPATLDGRPVAVVFYTTVKVDATEPPPAGTTVAR